MARVDDLLVAALKALDPKPPDDAPSATKRKYSQDVSNAVAQAFAEELRNRGMEETRPAPPGELGVSGAERRLSGGIGAKQVDVSWATEESGLVLALSIKTINFRDQRTLNFQKNLTNRRGDLLFEAVTLHRRFPYGVLGGFFFLDGEAASDDTDRRRSTFHNAHDRLRLFTGRHEPFGRDEQLERLHIGLLDANPFQPHASFYEAGDAQTEVPLEQAFDDLVWLVAERNADFYQYADGSIEKI